ncbi:IPT/TIG domain-containing protein [Streptomyces sp. NPDC001544]|uniref:IPT/TIG domain-containing protein n=1 Tax=Streptomyces sp. NPDC001544 TaxID=3364584 RepID=UPI0036915686
MRSPTSPGPASDPPGGLRAAEATKPPSGRRPPTARTGPTRVHGRVRTEGVTAMAAPVVSSVSPTQGPASGGTTVTVTGSGFTGATAVRFGAASATSFTVVSSTQITAVSPPGNGPVNVTVTTSQGTSSQSVLFTYVTVSAPTLTSLAPTQGPVGTSVTLTGTNLTGATAVRFDGVAASSFTVDSATQITAVAPAHAAGASAVTVTTAGGTSNALTFTYLPAPALSSLTPTQGPVLGGTSVTLTGTNLTGATAVRFDGVAASSFTVDSATQITAIAPAHAAGASAVTVTTAGGTSNSLTFTYLAAPAITGVSPTQGPTSGGTSVTLTGTNLTGATAVRFDGVAASSFTVDSATQITAIAPAHAAGAAAVTVTTPGGTSSPDNPQAYFFYAAAPSLTAVAPPSGATAGGTTVTLTGTGLLGATAVRFDTLAATSFTVNSATQITAVTPAHAAGTAAVTVTTPGGTSNPVAYVYLAAPALASLVPDKGPTQAGTVVTVTGTNLTDTTGVQFGSTPVPFTVVSPTQLTAAAPAGTAGPVTVTVTTPAGTSNSLTYTRIAAPGI